MPGKTEIFQKTSSCETNQYKLYCWR